MLTKDLLRYRSRKDRIYPTLIKVDDPELLALAAALIQVFKSAPGSRLSELDDEIESGPWLNHVLLPAFKKLLLDRCDEIEEDGVIADRRTDLLQAAEKLRRDGGYPTLADFHSAMMSHIGEDVASMQERLYADLPEFRKIKTFEELTPEALLHRYNSAQIQGLLLVAQEVEVRIVDANLAEKRKFFRCLKFQRLLSSTVIDESAKDTVCKLSGPLKIFQNSQSYGMRLAQFFPYILQMPKWQLSAEIKIGGKVLTLELDHRVGIQSHYKKFTPFVPPELTAFISSFNERKGPFAATVGEEFLALGQQSYCFPDVTFTGADGGKVHLEIFHRWHAGQLANRLKVLATTSKQPLVIGVAQDVANGKDTAPILEESAWFSVHGFIFKNLPTPKSVQQVLVRHAAASAG